MEVPISEDEGVLTEWAPYTNLINQIPLKILSGLFTQDLSLTCIDATNEYLALGTNTGLVFWYSRQNGDLQRLRCEVSNSAITFVKIVSTVDFMVAAGNKIGQVTVFEIPKTHPDSLPESLKPKVARKVERYTVGDLHQAEITYIEWSKNGMRLFSGDKNGLVVMTEIDFYMHLCKSSEIINESYEIVQISYYQNYLLVSSVYRSIVCQKKDLKWDVNQVGKRDRKSLCSLGGVFQYNYERPNEVNIYCARPGLRIWTSDRQGNVLQTLLFKDAISNPCSRVELLNPSLKRSVKANKETHFGPLFVFKDKYLISHNEAQLYILNPDSLVAVATVDNVRRILSVAVNKEEIFILEGDRSLIRIAYTPESQVDKPDENLMTKSLTNPIQLAVNTIKELASLQTQVNLSGLLEHCDDLNSEHSVSSFNESPSIAPAEECFELPLVQELPKDINTNMLDRIMHNIMGDKDGILDHDNPNYTDPGMDQVISGMKHFEEVIDKKNHTYNLINGKGFEEDILYKSKKSRRNNVINLDSCSTDSKESPEGFKINGDCSIKSATVEIKDSNSPRKPTPLSGMFSSVKSLPPGNMSPESIEKEIEAKEEILAKVLDLEPITISTVKLPSPEILYMNNSDVSIPNAALSKSLYVKLPMEETRKTQSVTKHITRSNDSPKAKEKSGPAQMESPPKCITIPNMWNLKEIKIDARGSPPRGALRPGVKITHRKVSENEDLDDWELV